MRVFKDSIRLDKKEQMELGYPSHILFGDHYRDLQEQNERDFDEALLRIDEGWLYSRSRRRANHRIDLSTRRAMFLADAANLVVEQAIATIDAEWQGFDIEQSKK